MAFKLADLFVELALKGSTNVLSGIGKIKTSLHNLSRETGLAGALSLTGLAAAMYKAAMAAEEAEKAQRRLHATIRLMAGDVGITAAEINKMAESLANSSVFDDDAIASASSAMLEFSNISKSALQQAIPIAVDLASRTGDLEGAFRSLGAALSDPAENIGLLRRQFRALSPEVLKAAEDLAKTGNVVGAQKMIMDELSKHTAGLAQSMVTDFDKARSSWGELWEAIGKNSRQSAVMFAGMAKDVADYLRAVGEAKKAIPILSEVVTAGMAGGVGTVAGRKNMLSAKGIEQVGRDAAEAELRAARGRQRMMEREEAELGKTPEQRKAQEDAATNAKFLAEKRIATEKERAEVFQALTIAGLTQEQAAREQVIQQLNKQLEILRKLFPHQEELTKAEELRAKAMAKFDSDRERARNLMLKDVQADTTQGFEGRQLRAINEANRLARELKEQGGTREQIMGAGTALRDKFFREEAERRQSLSRSMQESIAPDSDRNPMRRKLEIDWRAEDFRKQIMDTMGAGTQREDMMGLVAEMQAVQQKQLELSTRKAPEFVGLTEMATRIQGAVGGGGRAQLEQQQMELLKKIRDLGAGPGLNVVIKNPETLGAGTVGP